MPCRSDYMEPNLAEENSKLIASMIIYVSMYLGEEKVIKCISDLNLSDKMNLGNVVYAANGNYGDKSLLEPFTQILCKLCSDMSENEREEIIYDGHISEARRLADWWDEHQEEDKKRIEQERQEMIQSKEYQINSSFGVARGRLENGANPDDVINWLEEEINQIIDGEILYND